MFNLENLGYKDITKDKPIHFIECLGEFFESVFPYNKRYYQKNGDIITILKVGNLHNFIFIDGICYYPKGYEKFEINVPSEYVEEYFKQTIKLVLTIIYSKRKRNNYGG